MDRRSFLSRTALGSSVALVGAPVLGSAVAGSITGCGGAPVLPELASREVRQLHARLDRGLARVRAVPRGDIARQLAGHPRPALAEDILRLGLETFVVADVVRSVPEGVSVPPSLQARLTPELPLVDRYTNTYHALLTRMPPTARRRLDAKLRSKPEAAMEVAGWIDEHAGTLGVAGESRLKLRQAALTATTRIRRQSTSAVIDDCLAKVDRVVARSGRSLSMARSIVTGAMIEAIWQQVDGVPPGGGLGGDGLGAPGPEPAPAQPEVVDVGPQQWSARWGRPGDEEIEIGAIMMPFGLLTCGLLLIIGLIVLIAGAVQNSVWDGTPQAVQAARVR